MTATVPNHLHKATTWQEATFSSSTKDAQLYHMAVSFKKMKNMKMKPICRLEHSKSWDEKEKNLLKN